MPPQGFRPVSLVIAYGFHNLEGGAHTESQRESDLLV